MNDIYQDILHLADLLKVPKPSRYSQDWEYELNIDSIMVYDFLNIYENSDLSDYQRELLLKIIIEMINDAMETNSNQIDIQLVLSKVENILNKDFNIHKETIYRYANLENDLSDCLLISPFFREFLQYL